MKKFFSYIITFVGGLIIGLLLGLSSQGLFVAAGEKSVVYDTSSTKLTGDSTVKAEPVEWKNTFDSTKKAQATVYKSVFRDRYIYITAETTMDSTGAVPDSTTFHYEFDQPTVHEITTIKEPCIDRRKIYLAAQPWINQSGAGCSLGLLMAKQKTLWGIGYDPFQKSVQLTFATKIY